MERVIINVPYDPPNWNKYIDLERANRNAAAALKRHEKGIMGDYCEGVSYTGGYPAQLAIRAHFTSKRCDLDNVRFKGLLDGIVASGVIENDNLRHIQRIVLEPVFDGEGGIDIEISPMEKMI